MQSNHIDRRRLSSYFPDYGAIFMANQSTKAECLERKLFGLPVDSTDFVLKVKAGMLLFLFNYHKRHLHGVFEASTDGGLDLVPDAYASAFKRFPAQVRFNVLWECAPLQENAFREAIAENYFARNKFNCGLSRDQVGRLLYLFEKKELKVHRPPRIKKSGSSSEKMNVVFSRLDKEHQIWHNEWPDIPRYCPEYDSSDNMRAFSRLGKSSRKTDNNERSRRARKTDNRSSKTTSKVQTSTLTSVGEGENKRH